MIKKPIDPDEQYRLMREYTEAAKPIIDTYIKYMSLQTSKISVTKDGGIHNVYDEKTKTFMKDILDVLECLQKTIFSRELYGK